MDPNVAEDGQSDSLKRKRDEDENSSGDTYTAKSLDAPPLDVPPTSDTKVQSPYEPLPPASPTDETKVTSHKNSHDSESAANSPPKSNPSIGPDASHSVSSDVDSPIYSATQTQAPRGTDESSNTNVLDKDADGDIDMEKAPSPRSSAPDGTDSQSLKAEEEIMAPQAKVESPPLESSVSNDQPDKEQMPTHESSDAKNQELKSESGDPRNVRDRESREPSDQESENRGESTEARSADISQSHKGAADVSANGSISAGVDLLNFLDYNESVTHVPYEPLPRPVVDKAIPIVCPKRAPDLVYLGKTGVCYDVRMRYHSRLNVNPSAYLDPHPEDPRRTFRIYKTIAEAGLITDETLQGASDLGTLVQKLNVKEASDSQLRLVHTQAHLDYLASSAQMSVKELHRETQTSDSIYLNNDSYQAARLSCGGAIEACRAVVEDRVKNALAIIRPPGHHAEPNKPGGFCLFSNVAVAASVMLKDYPDTVKRIVVLDWDIHHGNGTQKCFFSDNRVLYISVHRYDNGKFYPSTKYGDASQVGEGDGVGFNLNIPWNKEGMTDSDYIAAFYRIVLPVCDEFDPDLVIISSGFDAADGDPIGRCHISPAGYSYMTHLMKLFARGKLVVCLEGGYNLDSISVSALAVSKVLLGDPPLRPHLKRPCESAVETIEDVIQIQSAHWKCLGPRIPDPSDGILEAYRAHQNGNEASVYGSSLQSLFTVLRSFETHQYFDMFRMSPLPILAKTQADTFENQVLATPDLNRAQTIVLIIHDPATIWAYRDPFTAMIRADDSAVGNSALPYLQWATSNNFGAIDVILPSEEWTVPGSSEPSNMYDLILHIWDSYLNYLSAPTLHVVGIGLGYLTGVYLASQRNIRDRCNSIVCFADDSPLKPVGAAVGDNMLEWFYKSSLIFTSSRHPHWTQATPSKRQRKKYGRVLRSNSENIYDAVHERLSETIEFILDQ